MKIAHLCLSCFYIDGYSYQENILSTLNKLDGHDVRIIASTETFIDNNTIGYLEPSEYLNSDNVRVIRLAYTKKLPHIIARKVRHYEGLKHQLEKFKPDVVYFHGLASYDIFVVAKYKKENNNVKFILDSHEDQYNSGTNFFSKYILHRFFYKTILKVNRNHFDKVYCVSFESIDFVKSNYGLDNEIELMPLGGYVLNDNEYDNYRKIFREIYSISDSELVFFHSGKMDYLKRTIELMESFRKVENSNYRLIIAGSVSDEISFDFNSLLKNDSRINYIGWADSKKMMGLMSACDVYLQPGTQSSSMQQSLCLRCAVALYPYPSHDFLLGNNYIKLRTKQDMINMFNDISSNKIDISDLRRNSYEIAKEWLDYNVQSKRYLEL